MLVRFPGSPGTTKMDQLRRAIPGVLDVLFFLGLFSLILIGTVGNIFWPSDVQGVLWSMLVTAYLSGCLAVYLLTLLYHLIRRYYIFPQVWNTGVVIALLTYGAWHMLFWFLDKCGGWEKFTEQLQPRFMESTWMYHMP